MIKIGDKVVTCSGGSLVIGVVEKATGTTLMVKTKYDPVVGDKIVKKRDLKHLNHYGLNVLTLRDFNIDIKFDVVHFKFNVF